MIVVVVEERCMMEVCNLFVVLLVVAVVAVVVVVMVEENSMMLERCWFELVLVDLVELLQHDVLRDSCLMMMKIYDSRRSKLRI